MKNIALDILNSGKYHDSLSFDNILDIGRSTNISPVNQSQLQANSSKMTHIDDQHCPKCHQPMQTALIGQEEVFFCQKHAVTLPKVGVNYA